MQPPMRLLVSVPFSFNAGKHKQFETKIFVDVLSLPNTVAQAIRDVISADVAARHERGHDATTYERVPNIHNIHSIT